MKRKKIYLNSKIRNENTFFNQTWIKENNFVGSSSIDLEDLDIPISKKEDSSSFEIVWLKNIDRLMSFLPINLNIKNYDLLDLGCGSGISSFYFASYYGFKSFYGYDISKRLIKAAEINKNIFLENIQSKININFKVKDVSELNIKSPSVLFMFNPFGSNTIEKFILNNLKFMKDSKSLILYANDIYVDCLLNHGKLIERDQKYNLSYIQF